VRRRRITNLEEIAALNSILLEALELQQEEANKCNNTKSSQHGALKVCSITLFRSDIRPRCAQNSVPT
jgi:hypothetical protein